MAKYLDSTGLTHLWAKIKNYVATYVTNLNLSGTYVAKESGKGLSTNDYTTTEKNKLAGIASGAEVNVNADWNASSGDAQILNKPSIPSKTSDITNDSGFITIDDVPEGAAGTTTTPKMDGTAAVGTETAFARGDHRHPSDTSKLDTVDTITDAQINGLFATISFTIEGTSYEAEDEMTWGEWVNSSYSPGGFGADSETVWQDSSGDVVVDRTSGVYYVKSADQIIANRAYSLESQF